MSCVLCRRLSMQDGVKMHGDVSCKKIDSGAYIPRLASICKADCGSPVPALQAGSWTNINLEKFKDLLNVTPLCVDTILPLVTGLMDPHALRSGLSGIGGSQSNRKPKCHGMQHPPPFPPKTCSNVSNGRTINNNAEGFNKPIASHSLIPPSLAAEHFRMLPL